MRFWCFSGLLSLLQMPSAHCHRIALGGQTSYFAVWLQDSSECSQDGLDSLPKRIFQTTSSVICNFLVFWGHGVRGHSEKGNILWIQRQTWMKGCLYNGFIITTMEIKNKHISRGGLLGYHVLRGSSFHLFGPKNVVTERVLESEERGVEDGSKLCRLLNRLFSSWMKLCVNQEYKRIKSVGTGESRDGATGEYDRLTSDSKPPLE